MARSRGGRIRISIDGDTRGLSSAVGKANREMKGLGKASAVGGAAIRGIGTAAKWSALGVGALGVVEIPRMINAAVESQKVASQTAAVLKSTGGAAHVTAKQVSDLANAISLKAGMDDEAIQSGENILLTFRNIRNEAGKNNKVFTDATKITADMSVALGKDLNSSAIMVGKALNDPIKGATALSRAGVQLTDQQKSQIETFVESGKTMKAQKIILAELNKEFAGSAAAQATPMDRLRVAFENLEEVGGRALLPVVQKLATALADFFNDVQTHKGFGGAIRTGVLAVVDAVATFVDWVKAAGKWLDKIGADTAAIAAFKAIGVGAAAAGKAIGVAAVAVGQFFDRMSKDENVKLAGRALVAFGNDVKNVAVFVARFWAPVGAVLYGALQKALPIVKGIVESIATIIKGMVQIVSGILTGQWGKVWEGFKNVFSGAVGYVTNAMKLFVLMMRTQLSVTLTVAKKYAQLIGQGILKAIRVPVMAVGAVIRTMVSAVRSVLSAAVSTIGGAASNVGRRILSAFDVVTSIRTKVTSALSSTASAITNYASTFAAKGAQIGQQLITGFLGALAGIADKIIGAFRGPINTVVDFWNSLSFRLDPGSIDVSVPAAPDIHVDIPGVTIGTPDLPRLAQGAQFDRATLAVIGEAGKEYAIPVSGSNAKYGRQLIQQAAADLGGVVMFAKGGVAGARGKGKKPPKGNTVTDIDESSFNTATSALARLLAVHAAAVADENGASAMIAPHKPNWATADKYKAIDGTYNDLETAYDLMQYWQAQVTRLSQAQSVKVGQTWQTYTKTKFKTRKVRVKDGKDAKGHQQWKKETQWWDGKRWRNTKTPFQKAGDEIPGTRHDVTRTGVLFDQLENANEEFVNWRDYIAGLFSPLDEADTPTESPYAAQLAELQASQISDLQRELAVMRAQSPILANFLGSFADGGIVPGPTGKAGVAVVHGGEEITPVGGGRSVEVRIIGDPALTALVDRVETVVDGKLTSTARSAGIGRQTPSVAGRRARLTQGRNKGRRR